MEKFAMSCILTKESTGKINIRGALHIVEAENEEMAIGKFTKFIYDKFPEHEIFDRVMWLDVEGVTL